MSEQDLIKPTSVAWAERLMYAGAVVAVLYNVVRLICREQIADALERTLDDSEQSREVIERVSQVGPGLILVGLVTSAVWVLVARVTASGHRVGRPIATCLGILGAISAGMAISTAYFWPLTVLNVINALIAGGVVVLLWRPDANTFFMAHRSVARDAHDARARKD